LSVEVFRGDTRTKLRITAGGGFKWANPKKALRHVRMAKDKFSALCGFEIPDDFRAIELAFTVERGVIDIYLPTLREFRRAAA
jgi:hypothetical protein